jgi:RimJ/RimL family protein N-acetyltransferase
MPISFQDPHILENEAVLLRPLQATDFEYLLPFSLNEPEIWKYSLQQAGGAENLEAYIASALEGRKSGSSYPFVVFDKRSNRYAGSTRFYDLLLGFQSVQVGYTWYGKEFQGTGLNAHCKYLLLEFAFEKMGMERVEFRADNNNARSIAAMKGIGCVVEGVLRQNMPNLSGGRRDSIVLSILKHEWESHVKALLQAKMAGR